MPLPGPSLECGGTPNQIGWGVILPLAPPRGIKIGKLGYIRQVSGAGAAITPCRLGGSVRRSWTLGRRRRRRSASSPPHSVLQGDKEGKGALFYASEAGNALDTPKKPAPASPSGSNRCAWLGFGPGPSVLVPSCSCFMWRITAVALKACCRAQNKPP